MSLFTLQSRCTNPTKHPLHRPSVDQTVKSKQPPIHRLLPRIHFHVPSVKPSPVEVEHVSTSPDIATNPDSTSHRSKLSGHICVWSSRQACDSDNGNPGNFLYCWALRIETSLAITHPDRPHEDERMKPLTPWAVRKAAAVSRFAAQGPGAPAMRYDSAI